ncbi:phage late control D family protein [Pseudomonas sp. RIT-PI-AD]|uniref:phage late control D family protein n=1 Tax=Pseudomonas sp. RIT-PI-AD TaxID=3035294 RepID=UPI0021D96A6B|nr:phage late control D family protein [Pseudomonas sp. RIT-PI-AD]
MVDGRDISTLITPRLIRLELTDNRGMDADQLSLSLADHDGLLEIPPRGATVRLWLGWSTTGLVDKGSFTVDEIEHAGAPDVLEIRARSVDLRKALKRKRERSFHATTLGAILRTIAEAHGLQPVVAEALAALPVAHMDQANESDANVITRLGEDNDAVATVKAGRLLFFPRSGGKTASGAPLGHVYLTRQDGDQHSYLEADRDSYDGVRAYYYDVNSAKKQDVIAGGGDNLKELRHTYSDRESALRAVRAHWRRLQRGTRTLRYTLALGRPELIPEMTYTLSGVKGAIDAIVWHGGNVAHSLTADGGLTTSLELEAQLPEAEVADLADEHTQHYTGVVAWYRVKGGGKEEKVTAGDQSTPRRLTHLYASKATAKRAVEREWNRLKNKSP